MRHGACVPAIWMVEKCLSRLEGPPTRSHIVEMKTTYAAILACAVIVIALIAIFAFLSRWELVAGGAGIARLDRWTGTVHRCVAPKGNDAKLICD